MAAHAKVPWLAGGFIGVDVFFVLSGYLITGLLIQEINATGKLGFANFYARRLRRLLPALLVMLAVICVLALIVLSPNEQISQAIAAATASVWLSNFHFAFSKLDYFSPGAENNLFLHTWSLGVEEQFYLVWPALLVCLLGSRRRLENAEGKSLKIAMFAIGGISLVSCVALTRTAPQMAFYLMPLRAWQFATGALVWLYFSAPKTGNGNAGFRTLGDSRWLGWLGLTLILIAGLWFDSNMAYPGLRALLPTLGAAAIIAAGVHGAGVGVSRALSWRPLQAVGRVSYSWYLWHWPVLLLGGVFIDTELWICRAGLVALSLLLAMLSYHWVETPIRRQGRLIIKPGATVLASLALMVIANVLCIRWHNAASDWIKSPALQRYVKAHVDAPIIYAMDCDDWYHSDTVHVCVFGAKNAKHTAVLMGDSIGAQWFPAIAAVFYQPDWRLAVLTKSSCPMVDEPLFYPRIGRDYVECTTWRRHALQEVVALHPDIVILGSAPTYDFNQAQWVNGTTRVLKTISGTAGHIYILRGTPHMPFDGPSCLSSKSWLWGQHFPGDQCHAPAYNQHGDDVYQWLQQASSRFGNVTTVDLNNDVCPRGECDAERQGLVVFRDSQHMTATFAKSLSGALGRQLGFNYSLRH